MIFAAVSLLAVISVVFVVACDREVQRTKPLCPCVLQNPRNPRSDLYTAVGWVALQVMTSAECQSTLWNKPLMSKHRECILMPQTLPYVAQLNCSSEYRLFFFPWNLDIFISNTVSHTIQMKTCSLANQTSDLSLFLVRHFDYNKWLCDPLLKSKLISL